MSTTAERMGVAGTVLPSRIRMLLDDVRNGGLTRDEQLCLAWALIDQASSLRTTLLAKAAMDAVEDLYDAEEVTP